MNRREAQEMCKTIQKLYDAAGILLDADLIGDNSYTDAIELIDDKYLDDVLDFIHEHRGEKVASGFERKGDTMNLSALIPGTEIEILACKEFGKERWQKYIVSDWEEPRLSYDGHYLFHAQMSEHYSLGPSPMKVHPNRIRVANQSCDDDPGEYPGGHSDYCPHQQSINRRGGCST